jgi:nicotinamide mononucleotide transporter
MSEQALWLIEWIGVVSGLICVWLNTQQNVWGWPIGLVNVLCYVLICFSAKLYADMGLQLFYGTSAIYGWYCWSKGSKQNQVTEIQKLDLKSWLLLGLLAAVSTAIIFAFLKTYTDGSVPFWDALATALSLIAQLLLARRFVENWLLWLVVNVLCVGIYYYKGFYLTTVLYAFFFCLAVYGYRKWTQELAQQKI